MLLSLYRGLTTLAGPGVRLYLQRRERRGKEDAARRGERLGCAGCSRPVGPLVWIHGASVGEANSALILVERLLQSDPRVTVMMTTGTVTSARVMASRLPQRAFHQYVPVDLPGAVKAFLDHWRPDAVLWMESELWPNLLLEIGRRDIPAALVNGRMSARSFRGWRRFSAVAKRLLNVFSLVLAQSSDDAQRFSSLGAGDVRCVGNMKLSAPPQPGNDAAEAMLRAAIGDRPVWLLASSHSGEEVLAFNVHQTLMNKYPNMLTIVLPRHSDRGREIAEQAESKGLRIASRSRDQLPKHSDNIYIADTMGEVGIFYRLVSVVCMGGSFVPHGGQNPVEPMQLGACVVYGPHMFNFSDITRRLEECGGAMALSSEAALAQVIDKLLTDPHARASLVAGAAKVAQENYQIVDHVLDALAPLLHRASIQL